MQPIKQYQKSDPMQKPWYIYLIKCKGNRLYTGITTNLQNRFTKHQTGKGASFTKSFPPIKMLAAHPYPDRSSATKAEIAMKKLTQKGKLQAIQDWQIQTDLPTNHTSPASSATPPTKTFAQPKQQPPKQPIQNQQKS